MSFDFSIPDHPEFSMLDPEEVHFFYYDIGLAYLGCISDDSIWEKVIEEFKDRVDICVCTRKKIPKEFDRNTLRFTLASESDKTSSFFRHLRNAFSHHRVHKCADMLYLIDEVTQKRKGIKKRIITMRGYIEYELLKEICIRFAEISDDILNSHPEETI